MKKRLQRLSRIYHWLLQPLLVLVILLIGYFGAKGLTLFKQEPVQNNAVSYAPLVKTVKTTIENRTMVIRGNGAIEARTRINIVPQVGGRIVRIHPQLRAGGYFKANEVLLEIEPIDYQLAVTNAESEVASAQRALQLEIAESEAAVEEWNALHASEPVPVLVSREPQIAETRASLKAAKAMLQQARLNLKRTRISMPFAGRVVEASIDVGEVVNANQPVGMVYSRELLEIPVPIEVDQLVWLELEANTNNHSLKEHQVDILIQLAGKQYRLNGRISRVESELDAVSRLARVVVSLKADDIPRALRDEVIPGLFVDVELSAKQIDNITVLPHRVLHEGGVIWIIKEGKLAFYKPEMIDQSASDIWIKGMPEHTEVITSALDVITEGMQVRTMEQQ
ncbi:MAG TPA: efflux RND transporter periplasmic adaptor subunit [Crenotrichaceae bacterium]|nr:efflux RND transporter periplasmic adaptor subunit [Crenotrichaceae bacterium]